METPSALPPPHPRLRVSRHFQPSFVDTTPQAGPSRFPDSYSPISQFLHENDNHEIQEDTPRLAASSKLPNIPDGERTNIQDTPADRLRALLAAFPTEDTVKAPHRRPQLQESVSSMSDVLDSDSDVPQIGSAHPSFATQSLKDLFSRARRDPDTPQKGARENLRRRNSIDTSEVEASPRIANALKDRSSVKGKRKSLSDDEVDPSIKSTQTSEILKHSRASTLQLLRETLSATALQDQSMSDVPFDSRDNSVDGDSFLKGLESSQAPATSTPQQSVQHSLRMSVNSQFHSNLLDQDSEMQQAMNAFDSFEASRTHAKQQLSRREEANSQPGQTSRSKSGNKGSLVADTSHRNSFNQSHGLKHTSSLHSFPRSPSPAPHNSTTHSRVKSFTAHDHDHGPSQQSTKLKTPELKHRHSVHGPSSRSASPQIRPGPGRTFSRHNSTTSIGSVDSMEDSASQSGSVGSQAEYRDLLEQHEKEKNHDREREWNKPRHRTNSNASIDGPPERSRTHSIPSRPSSRLSVSSVSHHRPSSRAGSSAGSYMSIDSEADPEKELEHEIEHERERNWNSPRPHWYTHTRSRTSSDASISSTPSRAASPRPATPTTPGHSVHKSTNSVRLRAESLKEKAEKARSPGSHRSPGSIPRPSSRLSLSSKDSPKSTSPTASLRFPSFPARPDSPTRPVLRRDSSKSVNSIPPTSPFPHSRTPLLEKSTSKIPSYQGHSQTLSSPSLSPQRSRSSRASLIPTPVKGKGKAVQFPTSPERSRSMVSSSTISPSIPTVIVDSVDSDVQPESLEVGDDSTDTDEEEGLAHEKTPTIKPVAELPSDIEMETDLPMRHIPEASQSGVSMSLTEIYEPAHSPLYMNKVEERLQNILSSPDTSIDETAIRTVITSPPSPPPSPPAPSTPEEPAQPSIDFPSTPPRHASSFASSNMSFKTPSPPKGLPALPGPPSSDEDTDTDSADDAPVNDMPSVNTTALKTPRPPGGWSYTPAPQRNGLLRAQSLPRLDTDVQQDSDSGLATPVASLSRVSTMPLKTPAIPGRWLPTPHPTKSVRFETENSVSTEPSAFVSDSSVGFSEPEPEVNLKPASERLKQQFEAAREDDSVKKEQEESSSSMHTPPPSNPVSPSKSIKSPGRKTAVNILNEYGNEIRTEPSKDELKKMNRSSVRIVDAMGREIDDTRTEEQPSSVVDEAGGPQTRKEAVAFLRDFVHDSRELHRQLDEPRRNLRVDGELMKSRIKELQAESEHARRIATQLQDRVLNEEDIKSKVNELRASMRKSKLSSPPPSPIKRGLSWLRMSWIYVLCAQMVLLFVIYRLSTAHARHYFLTTYYDPYYSDLHLYTSTPEYPNPTTSITDAFWREGLRGSALQGLDNVITAISHWHNSLLRLWGIEDIHIATATAVWPPT